MHGRRAGSAWSFAAALAAIPALIAGALPGRSASAREQTGTAAVPSAEVRTATEHGLVFLQKDAAAWRQSRQCASCHHGTMTVWALAEARARGYAVSPEVLADTAKWTKDRLLERIDLPRDPRPGWSMVSTPALLLAVMAELVPGQDAVSPDELKRIGGHLVRHQEKDGSWSWASAPAQNRPPPVFESDEVATLLARAALTAQAPADPKEVSPIGVSLAKGADWLRKVKPADTTQAAAFRLLSAVRSEESGKPLRRKIDALRTRQNRDGGWSQTPERPSDAYATGQAIYFLSVAGVKHDRSEIRRGVAFLVATQKEDGSWPMEPRAHPGAVPSRNLSPIIHTGSAWATLGLLRAGE